MSEQEQSATYRTVLGLMVELLARGLTAVLMVWLIWLIMTNVIEFTNSVIA